MPGSLFGDLDLEDDRPRLLPKKRRWSGVDEGESGRASSCDGLRGSEPASPSLLRESCVASDTLEESGEAARPPCTRCASELGRADLGSLSGVPDPGLNPDCSPLTDGTAGLIFSKCSTSIGKSATPIIKLPIVPRRADVAPLIGSQGPSSESYSLGRYLAVLDKILWRLREVTYNLRSLKSSRRWLPRAVAANALNLILVRLTRHTAARVGTTAHLKLSTPSFS